MNEQNLDVNLIIQSFQEKVSALITEIVVKDATIKQLTAQIQTLSEKPSISPKVEEKKDK
jgi:hypothetical protein